MKGVLFCIGVIVVGALFGPWIALFALAAWILWWPRRVRIDRKVTVKGRKR